MIIELFSNDTNHILKITLQKSSLRGYYPVAKIKINIKKTIKKIERKNHEGS